MQELLEVQHSLLRCGYPRSFPTALSSGEQREQCPQLEQCSACSEKNRPGGHGGDFPGGGGEKKGEGGRLSERITAWHLCPGAGGQVLGAGMVPRQQMGTEQAAFGLGRGWLLRADFSAENVQTAASLECVHL